jgi:PAS domain S-box-containing protein
MQHRIAKPLHQVAEALATPLCGARASDYLVAVVSVVAVAVLAQGLNPLLSQDAVLLVFILAVSLAGWLGGVGPGLLATALSVLTHLATRLPHAIPWHSGSTHAVHIGLFVAIAVVISLLSERRLRVSRELQRTAERFAAALKASRMVAWEWQLPEGAGHIFGDTSLWGAAGAPRSRADVWSIVHPDDVERARTVVEDSIARGDSYVLRYRVVRPDGVGVRWLEAHGTASGGSAGRPTRLFGVTLDITERVLAEQHLNRTNAILAAFVRTTPNVMVVKDRDSRLLMANPALLRALGKTEGEVLGRNSVDFFGAERGEAMLANDRRVMATGVSETFEELIPFDDGLHVYLSTKSPLHDEQGRVVGVVVLGKDITERKRMENALRSLHEQLRIVTDTMSASVALCGADLTYRWVSRAYASWFGMVPEGMAGRSIAQVLGEAASARLSPHFERVLAGERVEHEDMIDLGELGPRWVHAVYTPTRDSAGAVDGWVAVIIDIDQRKRSEEALREAARRKDEFLATLAHELRNPLAPLRNGLEILRMAPDPGSAQQARAMMERQLGQMVRLVDDLLDLSRITRGMVELRMQRCELSAVARNAVETSRPLIEARGHRLTVKLPEAPVTLIADATRLSQVLANLLNNSAKYTQAGGRIELAAACEGTRLAIRVRDSGMGIAAPMLARIFDPFVQVARSADHGQGGLGIGLTLVRQLVEMHDGTVEAYSEGPDRGSEFLVRLPLRPALEANTWPAMRGTAAGGAAAPSASSRRLSVLIADDNRDGAQSMAQILDLSGHRVHTVHDGHEAVNAAASLHPDVALLDIGMPGLDGLEAARRIRTLPGCEGTLLIALTGWGQAEDRRRSSEAGFDHHLVKPVDLETLHGLLRGREPSVAVGT